jgi:hypothetical protein
LNPVLSFTGLQRLLVLWAAYAGGAPPGPAGRSLKKCRPDWDITTPELKEAWQQGRKDLFYPYGKTYAQILAEQD